jgi:hypothetical protein
MALTFQEIRPMGDVNKHWRAHGFSENGKYIIAGTYKDWPGDGIGRLFRSENFGGAWTEIRPAGDTEQNWAVTRCNPSGQYWLAGIRGGQMYKSSDYGVNWSTCFYGVWKDARISETGQYQFIIARDGRLWISSNYGANWSETRPVGDSNRNWISGDISADGTKLVAACRGGYDLPVGVFYSSNFGTNWERVLQHEAVTTSESVTLNEDGSVAYYTLSGFDEGVFKTTDFFNSITEVTPVTPSGYKNFIRVETDASGDVVLASRSSEFFVSYNGGTSWTQILTTESTSDWWRPVLNEAGTLAMVGNRTRLYGFPIPPVTTTINSKGRLVYIGIPHLIDPENNETDVNTPKHFRWKIPVHYKGANVGFQIQVDKTDETFGDLEKDLKSWVNDNFEYWNGSEWVPIPPEGVSADFRGNEARVLLDLTLGEKYWRVRAAAK